MGRSIEEDAMSQQSELETRLASGAQISFLGEIWGFLAENKKWWLLPILVTLGLVGGLILLSGSAAAPFIYSLF